MMRYPKLLTGLALSMAAMMAFNPAWADSQNGQVKTADSQPAKGESPAEGESDVDLLIKTLVDQGVLDQARAQALRDAIRKRHQQEQAQEPEKPPTGAIQVQHVPKFIQDKIRADVEKDMDQHVVSDVMSKARKERWGVPDSWPDWLNRIHLYGDLRTRAEAELFASDNAPGLGLYPDYNEINKKRELDFSDQNEWLNTQQNVYRLRARARVGVLAQINDSTRVDVRLATGSTGNPVSTNVTLGNGFTPFQPVIDRAYIEWHRPNSGWIPSLKVDAGRMKNPWFSTDLVWDGDLNFDGVAVTTTEPLGPFHWAPEGSNLFATVGAFPVSEYALADHNGWLYAGQVGAQWKFTPQLSWKVGAAYYAFENIDGKVNALDTNYTDYTAPDFVQKGNTMFNIARSSTDPFAAKYARAAKYHLVDLVNRLDIAYFQPVHVVVTLDVVKNIGYDTASVAAKLNDVPPLGYSSIDAHTKGYQGAVDVGYPSIRHWADWSVGVAYKYLQQDAVVDSFTDSDFHGGGTDAKGWILDGKWGLADNLWTELRWISAQQIDGPPLAMDTIQLDLNTRF